MRSIILIIALVTRRKRRRMIRERKIDVCSVWYR
jgi:hypothetical protein